MVLPSDTAFKSEVSPTQIEDAVADEEVITGKGVTITSTEVLVELAQPRIVLTHEIIT